MSYLHDPRFKAAVAAAKRRRRRFWDNVRVIWLVVGFGGLYAFILLFVVYPERAKLSPRRPASPDQVTAPGPADQADAEAPARPRSP